MTVQQANTRQNTIDRAVYTREAQRLIEKIRDAIVLPLPNSNFVLVLGDAGRCIHKVWPTGDHQAQARQYTTPADAKNALWVAAETGKF